MKQKLKHSAENVTFWGLLLLPNALMLGSIVLIVHFGIEPLFKKWV